MEISQRRFRKESSRSFWRIPRSKAGMNFIRNSCWNHRRNSRGNFWTNPKRISWKNTKRNSVWNPRISFSWNPRKTFGRIICRTSGRAPEGSISKISAGISELVSGKKTGKNSHRYFCTKPHMKFKGIPWENPRKKALRNSRTNHRIEVKTFYRIPRENRAESYEITQRNPKSILGGQCYMLPFTSIYQIPCWSEHTEHL